MQKNAARATYTVGVRMMISHVHINSLVTMHYITCFFTPASEVAFVHETIIQANRLVASLWVGRL